jgi:hypothetical protein
MKFKPNQMMSALYLHELVVAVTSIEKELIGFATVTPEEVNDQGGVYGLEMQRWIKEWWW